MQELAETVGRSAGLVLMAPPSDSEECRAALNTLVTALKKQKVSDLLPLNSFHALQVHFVVVSFVGCCLRGGSCKCTQRCASLLG